MAVGLLRRAQPSYDRMLLTDMKLLLHDWDKRTTRDSGALDTLIRALDARFLYRLGDTCDAAVDLASNRARFPGTDAILSRQMNDICCHIAQRRIKLAADKVQTLKGSL